MIDFQHSVEDDSTLAVERASFYRKEARLKRVYIGFTVVALAAQPLVLLLIVYVFCRLISISSRYRKVQYDKHRCNFFLQFITIFLAFLISTPAYYFYFDSIIGDSTLGKNPYFVLTFTFMLQAGCFLFIATKPTEDCFACFNKLGSMRTYSSYQYPVKDSQKQDNY